MFELKRSCIIPRTMNNGFRSRFEGRRISTADVEQLKRELEQALAANDSSAMQGLLQELDYARSIAHDQLGEARREAEDAERRLEQHLKQVEIRNRNLPPGKRPISADADPYLNRLGALFDDEDAKVYEQWAKARKDGFRDPYEQRRKRVNRIIAIVVSAFIVLLVVWIFSKVW